MTVEKHAYQIAEELQWSNARVSDTFLGVEDHGILTGIIHCEGESWSQGFGCRSLEDPENLKKFITGVMQATRSESWEKIKGSLVRIGKSKSSGHSDMIIAIRPIVDVGPIYVAEKVGDVEPGVYR